MLIPVIETSDVVSLVDSSLVKKLSLLNSIMIRKSLETTTSSDSTHFPNAIKSIRKNILYYHDIYFDGFSIDQDDEILTCLDKGLNVAFIKYVSLSEESPDSVELFQHVMKTYPANRIGLSLSINDSQSADVVQVCGRVSTIFMNFNEFCQNFLITLNFPMISFEQLKDLVTSIKSLLKSQHNAQIYLEFSLVLSLSPHEYAILATFHEQIHIICKSSIPALSDSADGTNSIDYIEAFIACLRTDRDDGLYTSVVCDEHGVCLGLVYSSSESIRVAVMESRGVYWSRSRGSLWRKGDTSGMYQDLLSIDVDCDGDALKFTVHQRGQPPAFCHLLTKTCWGEVNGINRLEQMLIDRKISAPAGSYTKRLFDDSKLLQNKLLEEVQELVEAVEPDHIAAEAADVLYFMMTRCVASDVTLRDIELHLDQRALKVSRRPGNAKEWRNQRAQIMLQQAQLEKEERIVENDE